MVATHRKTKMVSFRLSGDEYHLLRGACEKSGARSVSELARSAMQRIILDSGTIRLDSDTVGLNSAQTSLRELQIKLDILSGEVDRLSRLMQAGPRRLLESVATGS
jgi:hypothetical protein